MWFIGAECNMSNWTWFSKDPKTAYQTQKNWLPNTQVMAWTKHELRAVQNRALFENYEYILPLVIEKGVTLPGLPDTIGYIDVAGRSAWLTSAVVPLYISVSADSWSLRKCIAASAQMSVNFTASGSTNGTRSQTAAPNGVPKKFLYLNPCLTQNERL